MSKPKKGPTNAQVLTFIVILSFVCALVLSMLASSLRNAQEVARELDRSQQMLISARIYNPSGYFQIRGEDGEYTPAKHVGNGVLVPGTKEEIAGDEDVLEVFRKRIEAFLIDRKGKTQTFAQAGIDKETYINENKKMGYADLPLKLAYKILPNPKAGGQQDNVPIGYVIPVNGFGLWDAIYGYLAIDTDGMTVIGISWYDHKETPGLGSVIAETDWQSQFPGKKIFVTQSPSENLERVPIGIAVVRGKVGEVIGTGPKSTAAVDGIPGATLTGNGVAEAYSDVLEEYRPFLLKINKQDNR